MTVSNYWQLYRLFNSWLGQTTNQSFTLLSFGEGNPLVTGGFPSQRASNDQNISMPPVCVQSVPLPSVAVSQPGTSGPANIKPDSLIHGLRFKQNKPLYLQRPSRTELKGLGSGDTCQVRTWYSTGKIYFCYAKMQKITNYPTMCSGVG